jgi:hypothetical protein
LQRLLLCRPGWPQIHILLPHPSAEITVVCHHRLHTDSQDS